MKIINRLKIIFKKWADKLVIEDVEKVIKIYKGNILVRIFKENKKKEAESFAKKYEYEIR